MGPVVSVSGTLLGVIATFVIARHYYLKSRAEWTFHTAFAQMLKGEALPRDRVAGPPEMGQELSQLMAHKWVLHLIIAYEKNQLYQAELAIACYTLGKAGELLGAAFQEAQDAVSGPGAPMALTPDYFRLRERAFRAKVSDIRERLEDELGRP